MAGKQVRQRDDVYDFRLLPNSPAAGRGVKAFVPWGLYAVVGEWGFFHRPADPSVILGENMNWNDEWFDREMFQDIPRNDLKAHGVDSASFEYGILENWVKGALRLNGRDQYCDLSDELLKRGYEWSKRAGEKEPCREYYDGQKRVTVDMGTNNFLIEVVFQATKGHTGGGIVSKRSEKGYTLDLSDSGHARMTLYFGDTECSRSSNLVVNDGEYHHVIAEVDRKRPQGINIYVDGKLSNGRWIGTMNKIVSLSNHSDFTVGRTQGQRGGYFEGLLDFLRISRGTLDDAETSIGELYTWEFDGPFLYDILGKARSVKCPSAGAIELDSSL
jgi:hypothetical protein